VATRKFKSSNADQTQYFGWTLREHRTLPLPVVLKPLSLNSCGIVTTSCPDKRVSFGIVNRKLGPMVHTRFWLGRNEVRNDARDGPQIATCVYARVKVVPLRRRASMFGVKVPGAGGRRSSTTKTRTFSTAASRLVTAAGPYAASSSGK